MRQRLRMKLLLSFGMLLLALGQLNGQITEKKVGHYLKYQLSSERARLQGKDTIRISFDTLQLPFWDDFSYQSTTPDSSLWLYGNDVFINNTYAYLPPSINVATFDGFTGSGLSYDTEGQSYGIGDSLVSKPIDLSSFTTNSNINLSFFWQEGFKENAPERQDSLMVSFKNDSGRWETVHRFSGSSESEALLFSQHFQRVNEERFLHAGFQFKFESIGNLSGDFDIWNVDYVYLNDGNIPVNIQDNAYDSYEDRTFTRGPGSIFGAYYALPLKHLEEGWLQENISPSNFIYNNLWAGNANNPNFGTEFFGTVVDTLKPGTLIDSLQVNGNFLTNLQDTALFTFQPSNRDDFIARLLAEKEIEDSVFLDFQFNLGTNDSLFFETINGVRIYYPELSFRQNDTVSTILPLHNYYAQDDGSAESRIQLNSRNYQLAQEFELIGEHYLTGIDLYVPNLGVNASTQNITLLVFRNLTTNLSDLLVAQNVLINPSEGINQFQRFQFERPVLVSGSIYIGYREENDEPVSIGFDKNSNSATKLFYNQSGSWEPNILLQGSAMIRPVFEPNELTLSNKPGPAIENIKLYPNPSKGEIRLTQSVDQVQLYDMQGRLMMQKLAVQKGEQIDISKLQNNLYLIKIRKGNTLQTQKVLLKK